MKTSGYYAVFNGNQSRLLLKNVDKLRKILQRDETVYSYPSVQSAVMALETFNLVVKKTFGQYLEEDYFESIQVYITFLKHIIS